MCIRDSSRTLELVAEIPATRLPGQDRNSRVVGLVDAPGQRFVFSLFDSGEIWIADFSQGDTPHLTRFRDIGKQPYDLSLIHISARCCRRPGGWCSTPGRTWDARSWRHAPGEMCIRDSFYFARLLPRIHSLSASVRAGSESLYLLDAEQF